jgi:predicted transcriptional regulator
MNLYEARVRKRITQWDLAVATGISQSKISLLERGYIQASESEKGKIITALKLETGEITWTGQSQDAVA